MELLIKSIDLLHVKNIEDWDFKVISQIKNKLKKSQNLLVQNKCLVFLFKYLDPKYDIKVLIKTFKLLNYLLIGEN